MTNPTLGSLAILAVLGVVAAFGLHRLALRLEDRGLIYYRRRPEGGASRMFLPLQETLDPSSRYVMEVRDERRLVAREDVPGPGDPDEGVAGG